MTVHHTGHGVTLYHGDALDVLRELPDNSVDAVVAAWDADKGGRDEWVAWLSAVMAEALRVTKPGGHVLVWALPRTSHWTGWAIENAGWEIRDKVTHLFGTGFPKSLDVGKAIDKAAGATREVVGSYKGASNIGKGSTNRYITDISGTATDVDITAPATPEAAQWAGWGTALKPAAEDWWLARKPLAGTVANNVLTHGTGALNIDGCRVGTTAMQSTRSTGVVKSANSSMAGPNYERELGPIVDGRWPANVVLDEHAAAALDQQSGDLHSQDPRTRQSHSSAQGVTEMGTGTSVEYADSGGASRFFYTAKADQTERPRVAGTAHPTVKPLDLMRWLVRLVTPSPGGTVLDPFAGSGTTVEAALLEGMQCIAIEREADYLPLILSRLHRQRDPVAYVRLAGDPAELTLFDEETPA